MERASSGPILVVDDDDDLREALVEVLEDAGYSTVAAGSGREALEWLLKSSTKPSCILLDLMMPGMDGWEVKRHLEASAALAGLPVVVVTADGHASEKAARMHAAAYLSKPPALERLLEVVRAHCAREDLPPAIPGAPAPGAR